MIEAGLTEGRQVKLLYSIDQLILDHLGNYFKVINYNMVIDFKW